MYLISWRTVECKKYYVVEMFMPYHFMCRTKVIFCSQMSISATHSIWSKCMDAILYILRCAVSTHHIIHTKRSVHIINRRRRRRPSERCLICGRYGCIISFGVCCDRVFFSRSSYLRFGCCFFCVLGPISGHTTIGILYLNTVRSHTPSNTMG